jgi:hypothetical protein
VAAVGQRQRFHFGPEKGKSLKNRNAYLFTGLVHVLMGLFLEINGHLPEREDREAADRKQGAKNEKAEDALRNDAAHEGKGRLHPCSPSEVGAQTNVGAATCADNIVCPNTLRNGFRGYPVGAHAVEVIVLAQRVVVFVSPGVGTVRWIVGGKI